MNNEATLYITVPCFKKIKDKYNKISALELLRRYVEEIGKPHVIVNIR